MTGTPVNDAGGDVLRVIIVDDEPLARRRMRTMLATVPDVEVVAEAGNGDAAIRLVEEHHPDVLLLDIQMPGKDGFAVLHEISGPSQPAVIFVTAHDEHAIRAFEVEAVDYLLKPVVESRLKAAITRVTARLRSHGSGAQRDELARAMSQLLAHVQAPAPDARLAVKRDGKVIFIAVSDVDWIEADGDVVRLHAGRAIHVMRATMNEVEAMLDSRRFVRVHRSSIVNVSRIREIQPWFKGDWVIILHDGTQLRTGRSYRAAVHALLRDAR